MEVWARKVGVVWGGGGGCKRVEMNFLWGASGEETGRIMLNFCGENNDEEPMEMLPIDSRCGVDC